MSPCYLYASLWAKDTEQDMVPVIQEAQPENYKDQ